MDLQTTADGNHLVIVNGDLTLVGSTTVQQDQLNAVRQDLNSRLRFILGEWFLNTSAGFDWFSILGQRYGDNPVGRKTSSRLTALLRAAILGTAGVRQFTQDLAYSFDGHARSLSISFQVDTAFGTLTYSEEVIKV